MTAKKALASVSLSFLLLVAGCHKAAPPSVSVCLLDTSQSIYPDAVRDEFEAMDKLADRLHRGDELVIIPIASDARNDIQGHIVRLRAPEQRAAFDTDLATFREEAHREIAAMKEWAISHPSAHTDILGTLQVAQQEFIASRPCNSKLVLLSDFLEDDGKWNFVTDQTFGSVTRSRHWAKGMRAKSQFQFPSVFLGRVRSRDGDVISTSRWDAVETFWGELLKRSNQQQTVHLDGIGTLAEVGENADAVEP